MRRRNKKWRKGERCKRMEMGEKEGKARGEKTEERTEE